MNKKKLMIKRNNIARLFNYTDRVRNRNRVVFNTGNSMDHEMEKAKICYLFQSQGFEYLTEARFLNGSGRPDIVLLDDGIVIEIIKSEEEISIQEKRRKYGLPIRVIRV